LLSGYIFKILYHIHGVAKKLDGYVRSQYIWWRNCHNPIHAGIGFACNEDQRIANSFILIRSDGWPPFFSKNQIIVSGSAAKRGIKRMSEHTTPLPKGETDVQNH
jgi:hypothetical protein